MIPPWAPDVVLWTAPLVFLLLGYLWWRSFAVEKHSVRPNMSLRDVFLTLDPKLERSGQGFYPQAHSILPHLQDGSLRCWGRKFWGENNRTLYGHMEIAPDYWSKATLRGSVLYKDNATVSETHSTDKSETLYLDLMVNRKQARKIWPTIPRHAKT